MKRRTIKSGIEGRAALAEGARKITEAVGSTFGPFGQNWFLDNQGGRITNDGVTVAREFQLPDEIENRGAVAMREAAVKTVEEVGDGTTTAIILAHAIYAAMARFLEKDGVRGKKNWSELAKQVETERQEITIKLAGMASPITTEAELINSAIVSTEDDGLGHLIGEAQYKIGKDGYVLAEETAERVSSSEIVNGIRIDNGFGTSQLINNQEKQLLEVEETKVLLTSWSIKTPKDWEKILKVFDSVYKSTPANSDKPARLVVIARAWTDECIQYALKNIQQGASIYPINAPYVDMQERFKDLAAITGANFYDSESSSLDDVILSGLGYSPKIIARRFDAIITGESGEEAVVRIEARVKELQDKLNGSKSDFEREQLVQRLGQLKYGFGIVKIGSPSDIERHRLFDKAEDAVHAVRAAYQEGTVLGAGLAFKEISNTMPDTAILKRPLQALYEQIISTAPPGFEIAANIVDPVKVLRVALEKACAAACAFASAGGAITEEFPKQIDELIRPSQNNS